jgi:hypothetical protein
MDTLLHNSPHPFYVIVDATAKDNLPHGAHHNRVPAWLVSDAAMRHGRDEQWFQQAWPDAPAPVLRTSRQCAAARNKLRPDLLLIHHITAADLVSVTSDPPVVPADARMRWELVLVEVGYTTEHKYRQTLHDKHQQHAVLVKLLQDDGWKVHGNHQTTVLLGTLASVPSVLHTLLRYLDVPPPSSHDLARALALHAVSSTTHLLTSYRLAITRDQLVPTP